MIDIRILRFRRGILIAGLILISAGIVFNIVAFNQAYAMLHYTTGGERTAKPEKLSFIRKIGVIVWGVRIPRPKAFTNPSAFGLPWQSHTIPGANGVRLAGWMIPAGTNARVLVIGFHGHAAEKSSLLTEAGILHRLGHAVLLIDFRGSGGSSGSETTIGYREAEDVGSAVAYARRLYPRMHIVVYGQSMGAVAILRAIAAGYVHPDAIILEAVFDTILHTVRNRFRSMGLPPFPAAETLLFWGGVQSGLNAFELNPVEYARAVRCSSLYLQGAGDPRARPEEAHRVFNATPGVPQWHLFPGVEHESTAGRQPDEWRSVVGEFLRDL